MPMIMELLFVVLKNDWTWSKHESRLSKAWYGWELGLMSFQILKSTQLVLKKTPISQDLSRFRVFTDGWSHLKECLQCLIPLMSRPFKTLIFQLLILLVISHPKHDIFHILIALYLSRLFYKNKKDRTY